MDDLIVESEVSNAELAEAFEGSNFGGRDHRKLLEASVLKQAIGYHCGYTITRIMQRLRLIGKNGEPLKRGRALLREVYGHLAAREGG
jgi:hypothetical protein